MRKRAIVLAAILAAAVAVTASKCDYQARHAGGTNIEQPADQPAPPPQPPHWPTGKEKGYW